MLGSQNPVIIAPLWVQALDDALEPAISVVDCSDASAAMTRIRCACLYACATYHWSNSGITRCQASPCCACTVLQGVTVCLLLCARHYIRLFNFLLLEFARPEAVIERAASLPAAYLRQYFVQQEHLSAVSVIRTFAALEANALATAVDDASVRSGKLVVYTRTTHDIATLSVVGPMQLSLLPEGASPDQFQVRMLLHGGPC
jgi:hypothetical protein